MGIFQVIILQLLLCLQFQLENKMRLFAFIARGRVKYFLTETRASCLDKSVCRCKNKTGSQTESRTNPRRVTVFWVLFCALWGVRGQVSSFMAARGSSRGQTVPGAEHPNPRGFAGIHEPPAQTLRTPEPTC